MDKECDSCQALHWVDESVGPRAAIEFESCCKKGDVALEPLKAFSPYLRLLYEEQDPCSRAFRKNVRAYNSAFAFTSLSYTKDTRVTHRNGIQCFQIHGELYHLQGPLIPKSQEPPSFAQLFFYDLELATNAQANQHQDLDRIVFRRLIDMLHDCNPYITLYKTAQERLQAQSSQSSPLRILLSPQMQLVMERGANRRRENLPTGNEIAVIIPNEYNRGSFRDIVLATRDLTRNSRLQRIAVTHPGYMPLHYVLLFPCGEKG